MALGTETLNANASKNKQIARASTKAKTNVAKATKAVNDGKAEKIEFIKHELQTAVTGAQKIYDDSKGVVLDDSTRTTLQSAIDQANALLQQDDADLNEMQQSITDVKDAGDAVTVSMNEYTAQQKYLEQQRQQEATGGGSYRLPTLVGSAVNGRLFCVVMCAYSSFRRAYNDAIAANS